MTLKVKEEEQETQDNPQDDETQAQDSKEETSEPKKDETNELKARLADIEAKNKELESKLTAQPAQRTVTSAELESWTDEQKEKAAELYGMPFDRILSSIKTRERADLENTLAETRATSNVREAIEAACDADPQVTKLKSHIREFLADIPTADKADAKKLQGWMKKAVSYARGQAGTRATTTPKARNETKTPGPDSEPIMETDDNDDGKIVMEDGRSIRVEKLIPDERRKEMKHPSRDNALRISCEFDKPPKMR